MSPPEAPAQPEGVPRKLGTPNRHGTAYSVPPGWAKAGGKWQHPAAPGGPQTPCFEKGREAGGGALLLCSWVGWWSRGVGGAVVGGCAGWGLAARERRKARRGPRSATDPRLAPPPLPRLRHRPVSLQSGVAAVVLSTHRSGGVAAARVVTRRRSRAICWSPPSHIWGRSG